MSDRRLRSDLIRLAARSTPEVKEALLPLLAKTAAPKPSAKGKKTPVPNQDMRKAYYTMGDGHQALKRAIEDPPSAATPSLRRGSLRSPTRSGPFTSTSKLHTSGTELPR